jgi:hypothetical protein
MRRSDSGVGCGACGRGRKRTPRTREAPGPRSGGTTAAPRGASLDWEPCNGFGSLKHRPPKRGWCQARRNRKANQETRARGQKSRDGAPRGARIPHKGMRQDGRLVRHSVLHPLGFAERKKRKTAYPAPQRIRAAERWLAARSAAKAGCLKFESVRGKREARLARRAGRH